MEEQPAVPVAACCPRGRRWRQRRRRSGGCNGGGAGSPCGGSSGGGGSDVRTTAGDLTTRILVAGRGGGSGAWPAAATPAPMTPATAPVVAPARALTFADTPTQSTSAPKTVVLTDPGADTVTITGTDFDDNRRLEMAANERYKE